MREPPQSVPERCIVGRLLDHPGLVRARREESHPVAFREAAARFLKRGAERTIGRPAGGVEDKDHDRHKQASLNARRPHAVRDHHLNR